METIKTWFAYTSLLNCIQKSCIFLDTLTPLLKMGQFALIWNASLNNKTFQLFDSLVIPVF